MIYYNEKLKPIFDMLFKHNILPVIVGGYVRDALLHKSSKDIDIELYNLTSYSLLEKILKQFGSPNSVGKSFGVCKLSFKDLEIDFSLPRTENKTALGHKGFNVILDTTLEYKTAAKRRDFTINSIGFDVKNSILLDPYHGKIDLKNKILKMVDKSTFTQDPLRILRAMQFCARFELQIDKKLLEECRFMVEQRMLQELPQERIYEEFQKLFLRSQKPSLGILFLEKIYAFRYFKELQPTPFFHKKLQAIDRLQSNKMALYLTLLLYDLNNTKLSSFLQKITREKKLLEEVILLHKYKAVFITTNKVSHYQLYKVAQFVCIEDILLIHKAIKPRSIYKTLQEEAKKLGIFHKKLEPLIEGKDLIKAGLQPSPKFSFLLQKLYEKQMQENFNTKEDGVKLLNKML